MTRLAALIAILDELPWKVREWWGCRERRAAIPDEPKPYTMLGQPITDAERRRISEDGP